VKTTLNKRIWLGILVMALVFEMTIFGCDSGGGGGNQTPSGDTLTDIPSQYEKKYAIFYAEFDTPNLIFGCDSYDYIPNKKFDATGPMISNGSVSIKSWCAADTEGTSLKRYSGNDTYDVYFLIFNSQKVENIDSDYVTPHLIAILFEGVKFTNGSVKRSWNEGKEVTL